MRDKSPHIKGEISEAMVVAAFVAMQVPVAKPIGAIQRFDLIADLDGLKKIQIKTGCLMAGDSSIKFNVSSAHWNYGSTVRRIGNRLYSGQIDYFAVYAPATKSVYLVPILAVTTKHKMVLGLKDTSNHKHSAKDFIFYKF